MDCRQCDNDHQFLCFALALWNGKDPILKERLFGLTNSEGNHGEDVKEYYFYLDSTPTHSYMKYLYKYPQLAYPYNDLVTTNHRRGRQDFEYELIDTGVFNQDRYFDVFVEYAKGAPEDILIQLSVFNRGPEPATLHVLPTIWFRNTWSWRGNPVKPVLKQAAAGNAVSAITASHSELGERYFYCEGAASLLFTENETNTTRLLGVPGKSTAGSPRAGEATIGEQETCALTMTGGRLSARLVIDRRIAWGDARLNRALFRRASRRRMYGVIFSLLLF
jgi:hypothetical protein